LKMALRKEPAPLCIAAHTNAHAENPLANALATK
jgi:hypothetical protein